MKIKTLSGQYVRPVTKIVVIVPVDEDKEQGLRLIGGRGCCVEHLVYLHLEHLINYTLLIHY